MDTVIPEQKPPAKSRLHRVLIAMIVFLSVFIVASFCLIAFFVIPHRPVQPRPMVLVHPDDNIVPAGRAPEDLEQAIRLTKEVGVEMLRNNPEAGRKKLDEMGTLLLSGQLAELNSGTACLLLETHGTMCRVQLTEGLQNGQIYWVTRQCVSPPHTGETLPVGFCCGAVYLRYLLTAAICCVGIYFLKLKSIFLQIMIFIIGMFVLNLIWVRIEMFLMF